MTTTDLISFDEPTRTFHLTNGKISYLMRVMPKLDQLENLYFGPAITHEGGAAGLVERVSRPANNEFPGEMTSLEHIRQEYPSFGGTDFRPGAFTLRYPAGDVVSNFTYQDYQVITGYPDLGELPHARYHESGAQTLIVRLLDQYSGVKLALMYTINTTDSLIIRSAEFSNETAETFQLEKALSASLDLPDADYQAISLHGAWARETHIQRSPLPVGTTQFESLRGASSHMHNPFIALAENGANETSGRIYSATLLYSGNFEADVIIDNYHVTRLALGIAEKTFSWRLTPHTQFQTPQAVLTCNTGLTAMSQTYHHFFREHIIDQRWADQPKPLLINNWEATYFNFDEKKLLAIADKASEVGIDLFVLDDGWFGHRDSDNSSLGNWVVDSRKLPAGLAHLGQALHERNLKFGLWFEPEMVSADTPLFAAHPDWVIGVPNKRRAHGRNQFVLDFANPAIVTAIFDQMTAILDSTSIDYVKWDMNRYISNAFSATLDVVGQGEFYHRYILGVYHLYALLLQRYPDLLIESCAGGGGRFDGGLLYYAPQAWASDDTDAIERQRIQTGLSLLYPLQSIGSHVSAVPNGQVGRTTPLNTRAAVAMFGTFGYELDLTELSEASLAMIKKQTAFVKAHQHLIFTGDFYRLSDPFSESRTAWMVVSPDKNEALVADFQTLNQPNPAFRRLKLRGLRSNAVYVLNELSEHFDQVRDSRLIYGDELENIGIIQYKDMTDSTIAAQQRPSPGDFSSQLYELRRH